jgi:hypothetical protein
VNKQPLWIAVFLSNDFIALDAISQSDKNNQAAIWKEEEKQILKLLDCSSAGNRLANRKKQVIMCLKNKSPIPARKMLEPDYIGGCFQCEESIVRILEA